MSRDPKRRLSNIELSPSVPGGSPSDEVLILIDRFGHPHSERVLTTWSPAVLKAMGIRPIDTEEGSQLT